ncbi:hypothetical protein Patl1_16836 [Pistacia atlantica]|uniref:Uncharacterized protein n=1 Tax=Pistacia atlantica TaxID=434234 RepID=A0ACC1B7R4_9ROSI|nr:hypothetical protein Patl1_16836 [Pistacia atlantica]
MENGFTSSPRNDTFNPAGLRVLVVDDDPTWLKILEKMLKKCSYEARLLFEAQALGNTFLVIIGKHLRVTDMLTTCGLARDALSLLRERKDGYDIVISDVNMPDMDGFKLLEHVGLEMDLPVIMMSVDGETSRVMKGVQHGACDYLLKPIRMKELRNIWQHVLRKRIHEIRDIECLEGFETIQLSRNISDQSDDGHLLTGEDLTSIKKRKDFENKDDDKDYGDPLSTKKARVVWSVDLHQKFVKAVNQIGFDKVGPKKILDLMNVPWLTRENVASHLQKYRLYLSRLQKENEFKTSVGGVKHTDSPPKDSNGSFGIQNPISMQQTDISNGSYGFSCSNSLIQNVSPKSVEGDRQGIVSVPVTEPKRALSVDVPDPLKARSSQRDFDCFVPPEADISFTAFDSTIPTQFSWCKVPESPFKHECKPLQDGFSQLPLPGPQHPIQNDHKQSVPSVSSKSSVADRDIEIKPLDATCRSHHSNHASPTGTMIDSFSGQAEVPIASHQAFEPISTTASSMKNQGFNPSSISNLDSAQRNINRGIGSSSLATLDEDLKLYWLQGDCLAMNLGLQDIDFSLYDDPLLINEVPFHLYDSRFDYEHPCDPAEYSVVDQSLFIA